MILVAIGANLAGPMGPPADAAAAALDHMRAGGLQVVAASPLYRTKAVGPGRQDDYVNLAARIESSLPPAALLRVLHGIEGDFGRARGVRWSARTLDLDLLAWNGVIAGWTGTMPPTARSPNRPILPHPALHERPFVVRPLVDIAPGWHHPVFGLTAAQLWRLLALKREGRVLEQI